VSGTTPKELRPVIKRAKALGCLVEMTRKNHVLITTPTGGRVLAAGTTANHRAVKNLTSQLRRHGVPV
jgi:hypothetical protein